MKTRYLFSHKYKKFGWVLFSVSLVMGILYQIFEDTFEEALTVPVLSIYNDGFIFSKTGFFVILKNPILDELITVCLIIGGILVGFSKLKTEDEFSMNLRTESLIWAFYVSSIVNILITIFVYGGIYYSFLVYNLFFQLLFFIARFHYVLYKSQKELSHEE